MTDIFNQSKKSSNDINKLFQHCINLVSNSLKELEDFWYQKEKYKDNHKALIQSLFSLLNYEILFIQQITKYYDLYTKDQHKNNYSMVHQIITINKTLINQNIQKIISLKFIKKCNTQNNIFMNQEMREKMTIDLKNKSFYPLNLSMTNKNTGEIINNKNTIIYRNNINNNENKLHRIFLNQMTQKNKTPNDLKKKFNSSKSSKNLNMNYDNINNIVLENENLLNKINIDSQRTTFSLSPKNRRILNKIPYNEKKNDFTIIDDNPVRKVRNIIINAKISNSFFSGVVASSKSKQKDENDCENFKNSELKKLINNSIKVNKSAIKNRIEINDWSKFKNERNNIIKVNYKKERRCGEILQDGMRKIGKRLKSASDTRKKSMIKNKSCLKGKERNK